MSSLVPSPFAPKSCTLKTVEAVVLDPFFGGGGGISGFGARGGGISGFGGGDGGDGAFGGGGAFGDGILCFDLPELL